MWGDQTRAAVFVPRAPGGARIAHREKLLKFVSRVRVRARVEVDPVPGPRGEPGLRIAGSVTLHGPYARVMFRQGSEREPATGAAPISNDSALLPAAPRIAIPEHRYEVPADGGLAVWLTFHDAHQKALANSICAGRWEGKRLRGEQDFETPANILVNIGAHRVSSRRGPVLSLTGELGFPDGLGLRLRLAQDEITADPTAEDGVADLVIVQPNVTIRIPQREVAPGAAANSWVSLMVKDWSGGISGRELPVGRCVRRAP